MNTLIEVLRRDETTERMRKVQNQDKTSTTTIVVTQQQQQQHLSWYGVDLSLVGAVCLYEAVQRGNAQLIRRLAACGARFDSPRVIQDTIAVLTQQLDNNQEPTVVLQVLQACIEKAALDPQLVLYAVARRRQWAGPATANALVQLLTSSNRGANVNKATADSDGITPLMMACRAMHGAMVTALLQHGASIAAKDKVGQTCLSYTVMDDSPKAPALWNVLLPFIINATTTTGNNLLEMTTNPQYARRTILHQAVLCLSASRLELFLQTFSGTRINRQAVDQNGWTALHYASFVGQDDKVQVVLQTCRATAAAAAAAVAAAADDDDDDSNMKMIHATDTTGRTPLHVFGLHSRVSADTHDFGGFVNCICLSNNKKINQNPPPPPPRRQEPTYWQVDKAIQILLLAGADPLVTDHQGNPPWVATATLLGQHKDDLVHFNSLYQMISVAALCGGINATILR